MISFHLTQPLKDQDFLSLYEKIRIDQDFYAEKFQEALFNDRAYKDLADHIVDILHPSKVMDIGCGKGKIVESLRALGVNARGMDRSSYLLKLSPAEIYPFLQCGDLLESCPDDKSDLVICMETLEHFSPQIVPEAISCLKKYSDQYILATIPSFGPNSFGPCGIQVINEEWMDDAKNDRFFRCIVVDDEGIPHHGHLTLATYNWWTEQFIRQGLNRIHNLETRIHETAGALLKEHHWNIYLLGRITSPSINFDESGNDQLGSGWYGKEIFIRKGKEIGVRWTERKAICYLTTDNAARTMKLHFYSGPVQLLYDFKLLVSVYHYGTDSFLLEKEPFVLTPDKWYVQEIDLGRIPPGIIQVTMEQNESWVSKNYTSFDDPRKLGIAVHRVEIHG